MKRIALLLGIFLIVAMLFACAPRVAPVAPVGEKAPEAATPVAKEGWEAEWENILKAAKKEGAVMFYTTTSGEIGREIGEVFTKKFGIEFHFVSGRGPELIAKMKAERRAGLHLADVIASGSSTKILSLKPDGLIVENLDKMFILPEVKEPKFWYKGEQMWADKERTTFRFIAYGSRALAINTDIVRPDEIKTVQDLLNPKWKGKIMVSDPTVAGPGNTAVSALIYLHGRDVLRQFVSQQEPIVLRDARILLDWLARGKYGILMGFRTEGIHRLQQAGAPVETVDLKGFNNMSGTTISILKEAPHPNAAKVFLNWFLSVEGQEINSRGTGKQSAREDINVKVAQVREPGVEYLMTHLEDWIKMENTFNEEIAVVFKPLLK